MEKKVALLKALKRGRLDFIASVLAYILLILLDGKFTYRHYELAVKYVAYVGPFLTILRLWRNYREFRATGAESPAAKDG
jgi:hypothetical protein